MSLRACMVVLALAALAVGGPAAASESKPTLAEIESEVVCPTCHTTLDQSSSPVANRMRDFNLLAWVLPPVVAVAAAVILGILAVRWSRRRGPGAEATAPDPAMERRIDDELARLDS